MPIDPSILLQGQGVSVPNPLTGLKDVASIANLMGEVQNRNLLGQATQQKLNATQAANRIFSGMPADPNEQASYIFKAIHENPNGAPDILKWLQEEETRKKTAAETAKLTIGREAGRAQWLANKPDVTWEDITPAYQGLNSLGVKPPPPQQNDTPQSYAKRYAGFVMSPENQVALFNSLSEDTNRKAERLNQAVKTNIEARTANQANVGLSPDNILYQKLPGSASGMALPSQENTPNPMYANPQAATQSAPQAPIRGNWDVTNPQKTIAQINSIPSPQDRQAALDQFKAALGPAGKEAIAFGSGSGGGSGPQGSGFQAQQIGPSVIQKSNLGETQKVLLDLNQQRISAIKALPLLTSMEAVDKQGMLSGQIVGSQWGQSLANIIASLPGVSDDYKAKVADTQVFQKDASNLIAQGLKAIGGGRILASEIGLLQSGNPSALQQPEARQAIYGLIRNQLNASIDNAITAQQHVNQGNYDLSGWTPKSQEMPPTPAEIIKQRQGVQSSPSKPIAPPSAPFLPGSPPTIRKVLYSGEEPPDPSKFAGKLADINGEKYRSNGTQWVREQ